MEGWPQLINKFLNEFFYLFLSFFPKNFFIFQDFLKQIADYEAQYLTFYSIVSVDLS